MEGGYNDFRGLRLFLPTLFSSTHLWSVPLSSNSFPLSQFIACLSPPTFLWTEWLNSWRGGGERREICLWDKPERTREMWMNSIHWTAFYSLSVVVYGEKYTLLLIQCAYTLLKGHAIAQLVEALRYKSKGRGFDSRWCHWNFSLT